MAGDKNFDKYLLMKQGREQYHLNKQKAGATSSSAGRPRPYARKNIATARLYSPQAVGQTLTVKPKQDYGRLRAGHYYGWKVVEPGLGVIEGMEISADEIREHFIVVPKNKGANE